MLNPTEREGVCNCLCSYIRDWHGDGPPREAVNGRQEVLEAVGPRQRHQVDVEMFESFVWYSKLVDWGNDVPRDFRLLTSEALPCPSCDIFSHRWPNYLRAYALSSPFDSRMAKPMHDVENLATKGERDERPRRAVTDVDDKHV